MIEPHEGSVNLQHTFKAVYEWPGNEDEATLNTSVGTEFTAQAATVERGSHEGEPAIRFFQKGVEYARAHECCWGHYYNCNRTRIGMYCQALDSEVS